MRRVRWGIVAAVASGWCVPAGVVEAAAGDLDPSFGDDGVVTTARAGSFAEGHAVVVQTDGKIVWVGTTRVVDNDFLLIRHHVDGSLDTTFGDDGQVVTDSGGSEIADAAVVQADGKIVVAGRRRSSDLDRSVPHGIVLARYHPDGSLDASFGDDGRAIGEFGAEPSEVSLALAPDGAILVAGTRRTRADEVYVARYAADGSLDASFGEAGTAAVGDDARLGAGDALKVQPDGRIVVAYSEREFDETDVGGPAGRGEVRRAAVARLDPSGALDATFGYGGTHSGLFVPFPAVGLADGVLVDSSGRIVVVGAAEIEVNHYGSALTRLDPSGSLDPTFGEAGVVVVDLLSVETGVPHVADDVAPTQTSFDLAQQSDGKLLTVGTWWDSGGMLVARFGPDGSLDPSFGADGVVVGPGDDLNYSLALQANGKIVVAGNTAAGPPEALVVRLLADRVEVLEPALVPELSPARGTPDGFRVQVLNYRATSSWSVTSTAGAAAIDSTGMITVTGLPPGGSATVTVTTSRPGYESGVATVTASALPDLLPPTGARPSTGLAIAALLTGLTASIAARRTRTGHPS